MHLNRALLRIAPWIFWALAGMAASASAQTNVRVTRDQTTIWTADFTETAAVVRAGTIPDGYPPSRRVVRGRVPNGDRRQRMGVEVECRHQHQRARAGGAADRCRLPAAHSWASSACGQFGYVRFAAQQSFNAILGAPGGGFYGGGAEVRVTNAFLSASVERFEKTGQRILVTDGEVFALGIPDTITVMPIAVSAGWRIARERATPYVGGGVGRILYAEQASFTEPSENVHSQYASYHVLGGVEFRNEWVATAFEVQYTRAPHTHRRRRRVRSVPGNESRRPGGPHQGSGRAIDKTRSS